MHQLARLFFITLVSLSTVASEAASRSFYSIRSLMGIPLYRLACSNTWEDIHTHVFATVNENLTREFKIVSVAPYEPAQELSFEGAELADFLVHSSLSNITIDGSIPTSYTYQTVSLEISDGNRGLIGNLEYNDGEGYVMSVELNCRATDNVKYW